MHGDYCMHIQLSRLLGKPVHAPELGKKSRPGDRDEQGRGTAHDHRRHGAEPRSDDAAFEREWSFPSPTKSAVAALLCRRSP